MIAKLKKLATSRIFIVGLLILLQFGLILDAVIQFSRYFVLYSVICYILAVIFIIKVINTDQNMSYKLAWSVLICAFPAFGVAIYMIFGGNRLSKHTVRKMEIMNTILSRNLDKNEDVFWMLDSYDRVGAKQAKYMGNASFCPPYSNCETKYYSSGEAVFPVLLEELEKAKKYIFLEYFIIGKGKMWDQVHDILRRKVREGVEVCVIYDDIGSIMVTDRKFPKDLQKEGIKCRVFNQFVPLLIGRQNNRDHRKICVIDGITAFTGGINIADEYINEIDRFGYWKDNCVMLRGECAWSFTVMFLSMWEYLNKVPEKKRGNYSAYRPDYSGIETSTSDGFVVPYTDNPLDYEAVGENVYLGILAAAKDYCWITTPYLIIDEQMEQALCRAAKSGVDVRIITPGIPDKKIVKKTTESFYPNLIRNGVKIYEYEPGFIHAKTFVCDDKYATVGSVNLDYRSLYLHFECGAWFCGGHIVSDVKADLTETFRYCHPIEAKKYGVFSQFISGILELLAPLL